jgi:hypothetical protein
MTPGIALHVDCPQSPCWPQHYPGGFVPWPLFFDVHRRGHGLYELKLVKSDALNSVLQAQPAPVGAYRDTLLNVYNMARRVTSKLSTRNATTGPVVKKACQQFYPADCISDDAAARAVCRHHSHKAPAGGSCIVGHCGWGRGDETRQGIRRPPALKPLFRRKKPSDNLGDLSPTPTPPTCTLKLS